MRFATLAIVLLLLAGAAPLASADEPAPSGASASCVGTTTVCVGSGDCIIWFQPPWNQGPFCLL
jgi:hypothetical protein